MARRAGLSQPEVSRMLSGKRLPTLRHVKGVAEALSRSPVEGLQEPQNYAEWLVLLVNEAERSRKQARVAPGRWARRTASDDSDLHFGVDPQNDCKAVNDCLHGSDICGLPSMDAP